MMANDEIMALTAPVVSPDLLTSSATGNSSMIARLPQAVVGDITIEGRCIVTDPTIGAGETLEGATVKLTYGDEASPMIEARTNEIVQLADLLNPGITTGRQLNFDLLPTTAVEFQFQIKITGPVDFTGYANPVLTWEITPSAEWGTITAFTLTARVICGAFDGGNAYYLKRVARAASASHSIDIGQGVVTAVYARIGADSALNESYLYDADGSKLVDYPTAARNQSAVSAWADYKTTAFDTTPNTYLFRDIISLPYSDRRFQLELASSQTALLFVIGPSR